MEGKFTASLKTFGCDIRRSSVLKFSVPYGSHVNGKKKTKRPMGLDLLLENQLGHLPKFHIYSLSTPGFEIELIFTIGTAVSEIWADF